MIVQVYTHVRARFMNMFASRSAAKKFAAQNAKNRPPDPGENYVASGLYKDILTQPNGSLSTQTRLRQSRVGTYKETLFQDSSRVRASFPPFVVVGRRNEPAERESGDKYGKLRRRVIAADRIKRDEEKRGGEKHSGTRNTRRASLLSSARFVGCVFFPSQR